LGITVRSVPGTKPPARLFCACAFDVYENNYGNPTIAVVGDDDTGADLCIELPCYEGYVWKMFSMEDSSGSCMADWLRSRELGLKK
jgi:hypothetical protein